VADDLSATQVLAQARALLVAGHGGVPGHEVPQVGMPLPVRHPDGGLHGWFVPLTVGHQITGFFQFLADGTLMRQSSFQRRPDSLANCPEANAWVDPDSIAAQARRLARPGETALVPGLTYQGDPTRLAWAVPLAVEGRVQRTVMVAGAAVWEAGEPGDGISRTGGA
jgi:hypothetical protein